MRIIDAHAHITSGWEELGIVRDVADSIRLMDRYDIEISFSSDSRALRGDYVAANDRLLDAIDRFPGRICGYAVANPWDGAGLDEVRRCLDAKPHPPATRRRDEGPALELPSGRLSRLPRKTLRIYINIDSRRIP